MVIAISITNVHCPEGHVLLSSAQVALSEGAVLRQHPIPAQPRREESHAAAAIDKAIDKLIHLALPVRLTHTRSAVPEFACTYDIHPHGARLASARDVRVGDLVTVERGRLKSVCRVMWTGDPNSELRGQFTVQCVEGGKMPWEDELRQMKEQYLPLIPAELHKMGRDEMRGGERDRRRRPRYQVEGGADVAEIGSSSRVEGRLEQISEFGCLISAGDLLALDAKTGDVIWDVVGADTNAGEFYTAAPVVWDGRVYLGKAGSY